MDQDSSNSEDKPLNPRSFVKRPKTKPTVDLAHRGMIQAVSTPEGLALMRSIMEQCFYQKGTTVADPNSGEIFGKSSAYCEGRRTLWLHLRQFIPRDRLILIEIPEPPQEQEQEQDE